MPYKYRLTITTDDKITEQIVDNKDQLCKILNVSKAVLGHILFGEVKQKYNYLKIERIFIPNKEKNKVEYDKVMHREANRKYLIKKKLEKIENNKKVKEEHINEILVNFETKTDDK